MLQLNRLKFATSLDGNDQDTHYIMVSQFYSLFPLLRPHVSEFSTFGKGS